MVVPSGYRIRPYRAEDLPAVTRIGNRIDPENSTSDAEAAAWEASFEDGILKRRCVVEEEATGTVVASAGLEQHPFMRLPGKYWTGVAVDPDHVRRGVGRSLAEWTDREAVALGAVAIWTSVKESDERARRFYDASGFTTVRTVWNSRLDVESAHLDSLRDRGSELAASGIRFTTLAEAGAGSPEVRHRYYELHEAVSADAPSIDDHTPITYDEFARLLLDRPGLSPAGVFLAVDGAKFVGLTTIEEMQNEPGACTVGFTGTLAAYRGRGIATELKRRALLYARAAGYRSIRTFNDSLNAPIWAINERLGFRRGATFLQGEKRFGPADPPNA